MAYTLFLVDLDDTLLDFNASQRLSFDRTLHQIGIVGVTEDIYPTYVHENERLWQQLEAGEVTKEFLKIERFRRLFSIHGIDADARQASDCYLEWLPQTVVLIDYAVALCEWLSQKGEIGIITNGIQKVQEARIKNSALMPYIGFISVSDACGFAKPDRRIFDYSSTLAKHFSKEGTLVVGDRLEADIQGAHNFGVDSCWYNPHAKVRSDTLAPTYEIRHLSDLHPIIEPAL